MIVSHTLVPRTVHGEPSGNYDGSSLDWYSDPVKAANYYVGDLIQQAEEDGKPEEGAKALSK